MSIATKVLEVDLYAVQNAVPARKPKTQNKPQKQTSKNKKTTKTKHRGHKVQPHGQHSHRLLDMIPKPVVTQSYGTWERENRGSET